MNRRQTRIIGQRSGFSLLEILLALAILGGSLAILSRIADTGMSAARESRDLAAARILAQTKLCEVMLDAASGITPQSIPSAPFDAPFDSQSSSLYQYGVDVQPAPMSGLLAIRVTVEAIEAGSMVRIMNPAMMMSIGDMGSDDAISQVASDATERLQRVAAAIRD